VLVGWLTSIELRTRTGGNESKLITLDVFSSRSRNDTRAFNLNEIRGTVSVERTIEKKTGNLRC
jgi:hypothetical protein